MSSLRDYRYRLALMSKGLSSQPIYRMALGLCHQLDQDGDLLDFGAGRGNFVRQLSSQGYRGKITGIDIQSRPADLPESIRWVEADLNDPIPLPDQSFHVIITTEVLPALENPRTIFREFFRLLRSGGTLVVTNPNQESIRSLAGLIQGGHFVAFRGESYPAHITALLRKDFERICSETGFVPPQFSYSNFGGIPKLPSILWQQVSFGLLRGRLFSDNLAFVTRKV